MKYITDPFKKIFDFETKASIKEFGIFFLFSILLSMIFGILQSVFNTKLFFYISILFYIPMISLGFRRLNDAGMNKFLFLIPFVNVILAFMPPQSNQEKDDR